MIKGVIFDYGGVIGTNVMKDVYTETAKLSGQSYDEVRDKFHKFDDVVLKGEMPLSEFWKRYAKLLNVDPKALEKTWIETYKKMSKRNESVIAIIKSLKQRGYKVGLLSNVMRIFSDHRKRWGHGLFDATVVSHEVGMRKPEKGIYDYTVRQLKMKPEECVFIDDRQENIEGAKAASLKAILFKDVAQLKNDLKAVGVKIE